MKYRVEEDRLTIWFLNRDAAEAAIQKGQLRGTIVDKVEREGKWEGKWGKFEIASGTKVTTLTDSENLSKFLADGGDKVLFPEKDKTILTRVK